MNNICTDTSQSQKLIELGIDTNTADMFWEYDHNTHTFKNVPKVLVLKNWDDPYNKNVPAWSLPALLELLPSPSLNSTFSGWRCDVYYNEGEKMIIGETADNTIDSCYETILMLKEKNLL